jgi:ABC-type Fe3+ transport system substrate-binding protein
MITRILIAGFGLCMCAGISGCGRVTDDELVVISPHSPEIRAEFSRGFSRWYAAGTSRTVTVKWLDIGGTGESIEYVRSRNAGRRRDGGVDVFFGGGDAPFHRLAREGLLVRCHPPDSIVRVLPREINGSPITGDGGLWYGAAVSGFGIIYNKEICRRNGLPVPAAWEDLGRPECRGWVSSGDPRYSGSIHMMYEILLQAYGWEKGWEVISRLAANVQTFDKGAGSAAKAVSTGQAAFGLAIDFYAFIEIERYGKDRLGFVMPGGATVVSADGIAVLKNAPSPQVAHLFVTYVLGEGQKLWILKPGVDGGPVHDALCRFPVDTSLYGLDPSLLSVTGNPFTIASALRYDSRLGGRRWAILGDVLAACIITPHEDLKKCSSELTRRGMSDTQIRKCYRSDISEAEMLGLAGKWSDRSFALERIRLMNAWTRMARKRYASAFGMQG